VGYKFTLVLDREITDEESAILQEAGCNDAIFGPDTLPTNPDVRVTKIDFDTTSFPTLAEAIQSALDAVKAVSNLGVPGLTVPAQPAGPPDGEEQAAAAEETGEQAAAAEETGEQAAAAEETGEQAAAAEETREQAAAAEETREQAAAAEETREQAAAAEETREQAAAAEGESGAVVG
jgi:hypothetical protein